MLPINIKKNFFLKPCYINIVDDSIPLSTLDKLMIQYNVQEFNMPFKCNDAKKKKSFFFFLHLSTGSELKILYDRLY